MYTYINAFPQLWTKKQDTIMMRFVYFRSGTSSENVRKFSNTIIVIVLLTAVKLLDDFTSKLR